MADLQLLKCVTIHQLYRFNMWGLQNPLKKYFTARKMALAYNWVVPRVEGHQYFKIGAT